MFKEKLYRVFLDLARYEAMNNRQFPSISFSRVAKSIVGNGEINCMEDMSKIQGIGASSLVIIKDIIETGTCKRHETALEFFVAHSNPQVDAQIAALCEIPGIGGKTAEKLLKAGLTVDKLKETCKTLKLGDVIGTSGVRLTVAISAGLQFEAHTVKNRMTVAEHDAIADPIIVELSGLPPVVHVASVGSRRRYDGSEGYTIGDIDIIVATNDPDFWKETLSLLDIVVMQGGAKVSGIKAGRHVDFRFIQPDCWGSMLLHGTGSMKHNIKMRVKALSMGMYLSEYGLKRGEEVVASKTEEEIFEKLEMEYIPPQGRSLK